MLTVEVKFFDRHYLVFPCESFDNILIDLKRRYGRDMNEVREIVIRT